MSHHDQDHHHHHDHGHPHDHDHNHADRGEMPFEEKMKKMIAHWIRHNADHVDTYRDWAKRARDQHMDAVADQLDGAAREAEKLNATFEQALSQIPGQA